MCDLRRFNVDDAVRRVRVQPIEALTRRHLSDVRRDSHILAAIDDHEVLVDVHARALHRIARNAIDVATIGNGDLPLKGSPGRDRNGRDDHYAGEDGEDSNTYVLKCTT